MDVCFVREEWVLNLPLLFIPPWVAPAVNSKGTVSENLFPFLSLKSLLNMCVFLYLVCIPVDFVHLCVGVCACACLSGFTSASTHLRMRAFVHVYIYGSFDDSSVRCVTQLDDTQ